MLIQGSTISHNYLQSFKTAVSELVLKKPGLAVVLVGNDPASAIYVDRKIKACELVGVISFKRNLPENISEKDLLLEIQRLNNDPLVDGILVQLPLPPHIDSNKVISFIDPSKDVDGFHPLNMGKLLIGDTSGFVPCTPLGIKLLLEETLGNINGKHVVIIGRSIVVGKPLAALLMQREANLNCTVTVINRFSQNLKEITREADILIPAVGKPNFVTSDMVKEGATVIDVGINRIEDPQAKKGYRIVGDVDFTNVHPICGHITPVPGGVGPMTIAMLIHNTLKGFHLHNK